MGNSALNALRMLGMPQANTATNTSSRLATAEATDLKTALPSTAWEPVTWNAAMSPSTMLSTT